MTAPLNTDYTAIAIPYTQTFFKLFLNAKNYLFQQARQRSHCKENK